MQLIGFNDIENIADEFSGCNDEFPSTQTIENLEEKLKILNLLSKSVVLLAVYDCANYSGEAWVIYEFEGKLYENHGGHCSCYGLEGQWRPEESNWKAIEKRSLEWRANPGLKEHLDYLINLHKDK